MGIIVRKLFISITNSGIVRKTQKRAEKNWNWSSYTCIFFLGAHWLHLDRIFMLHGKLIAKSCFSVRKESKKTKKKKKQPRQSSKSKCRKVARCGDCSLRLRHAFIKVTRCDAGQTVEQGTESEREREWLCLAFICAKLLIYVRFYCLISLDWVFVISSSFGCNHFHVASLQKAAKFTAKW